MYLNKIYIKLVLIATCCFLTTASDAQSEQVTFGKNRVQYHDDFDQWMYYETPFFIVNWYGKSRATGQKIVRITEQEFKDIVKTIDFKTNEKTEFIVFADITDLKQSNIGNEDAFEWENGLTKTDGNKIFIYFDGNHNHLRRQVREGLAAVYINTILFGSNLQEIVQNSIMLNLPEWYKTGLISYFGSGWNEEIVIRLQCLLAERKVNTFERLAKRDPQVAGHLFWHYLDVKYGKSTIGNLVYVTRINRNLKRAFQYALGIDYDTFLQNVFQYYQSTYPAIKVSIKQDKKDRLIKLKSDEEVTALLTQPTGNKIAIASNRQGKVKIQVFDPLNGKTQTRYRYGVRNKLQPPDKQYPILAWSQDGKYLMSIYERRDHIFLRVFDLNTHKSTTQIIPEKYQRIYSAAFFDSNRIVLNANLEGYSDIFLYDLRTRQSKAILDDPYDDMDVCVAYENQRPVIYFSSNRKSSFQIPVNGDSILPVGPFDIYKLIPDDIHKKDILWQLNRITFTDHYNESRPVIEEKYGLLHFKTDEYEKNAILTLPIGRNYQAGDKEAFIYSCDNIIENYSISDQSEIAAITGFDGKKSYAIKIPAVFIRQGNTVSPQRNNQNKWNQIGLNSIDDSLTKSSEKIISVDTIPAAKKFITQWRDIQNHRKSDNDREAKTAQGIVNNSTQFMTPLNRLNIVPYRLQFRVDESGARFDNQQLFEGLSTYTGTGDDGLITPMGLHLIAVLKDKFDDYRLTGGARIPISLNGNETYLVFDNVKNRLDYRLALYRKVLNSSDDLPSQRLIKKNIVLLGQYEIKYPIDIFNAFKLGLTLRQDKNIIRANSLATLEAPTESLERIGLRATYVIDNMIEQGLNLYDGTRAKAFVEWVKKFDLQTENQLSLNFNKGHMWIAGFDARHYFPLDDKSVLAGRLASQLSFGSEKILYYLGGVNGWLFPSFDPNTRIDESENYAYRSPVSNLRGFRYNIRNGNNFALTNIELRVPLFRYFSRNTIKSAFLNNFQFNFFLDAGTAWTGVDPFAKYNPLNTTNINLPDIEIKVNYFRNPIVFGYGAGIRLLLFGYFARIDYAWGYDSGNINPPRFYLSLGTDF